MKLILLVCVVLCIGCDESGKSPSIKVTKSETNNNNSIHIEYLNHNRFGLVELKTVEEIKLYKTEIEFLLKQLDEAEKKMTINEDKNLP